MWPRSKKDKRRTVKLPASMIGEESEAFLGGRLHLVYQATGRSVPAWAWVNPLAHGTFEELFVLSEEAILPPPGARYGWSDMLARLAEHIVAMAGGPEELDRLQRSTLWPLESRLLDHPFRCEPFQLSALVLAALHDHPARWR